MTPLLSVRGLTKRYGRLTALSDVTFDVHQGEVLGLIGPNGSGKTTLFECLGGVLPYEAGEIARPEPAARHTFYLPDGIAPWPSQTVDWAIRYVLGLFGGPAERREVVLGALAIEPLLSTPVGHLSKGQRKRVLLAIGLLTPHPLLLADEPFDGLDLRQTREVGRLLRDTAATGRTLFLSIHQISDAAKVCDRYVLLNAGRVCGEGAIEAGLDLEEVFLALT
jgi:ABC-type multidrug transport system ATPase subunit